MASTDTEDPYRILGVSRTASKQEIQAAYKKKARELHPDVNKAEGAEDQFKQLAAAYSILKDEDQRRRYDTHGFSKNAGNRERQPSRSGFRPRDFGFDDVRFEDINIRTDDIDNPFDLFLRREQRRRKKPTREVKLGISLAHAYHGTTLSVVLDLPNDLGVTETRRIRIKIPKGAKEGDRLKLKDPDCTVVLSLDRDPNFPADGRDIHTTLKVSPWELALGSKVTLQTPGGPVNLKVPAGSASGRKLRLRAKGLPTKAGKSGAPGDLYATIEIVVPPTLTAEERELMEKLAEVSDFDPRS